VSAAKIDALTIAGAVEWVLLHRKGDSQRQVPGPPPTMMSRTRLRPTSRTRSPSRARREPESDSHRRTLSARRGRTCRHRLPDDENSRLPGATAFAAPAGRSPFPTMSRRGSGRSRNGCHGTTTRARPTSSRRTGHLQGAQPRSITADGGGVAIGVGASAKDTGAPFHRCVPGDNYINNTIKAYIDNSGLPNHGATSVSAAGNISLAPPPLRRSIP